MRRRRFLVHKVETRAYINVEHNANITTQQNLELLVSIRKRCTFNENIKTQFENSIYEQPHML